MKRKSDASTAHRYFLKQCDSPTPAKRTATCARTAESERKKEGKKYERKVKERNGEKRKTTDFFMARFEMGLQHSSLQSMLKDSGKRVEGLKCALRTSRLSNTPGLILNVDGKSLSSRAREATCHFLWQTPGVGGLRHVLEETRRKREENEEKKTITEKKKKLRT